MALDLIYVLSLAAADAVNPCALAVMAIVLTTLLLKNPKDRSKVLYGGLAFTIAVFICYLVYGILISSFFSTVIPETGNYSYYIFRGFGLLAIILGLFNLKDFLYYQPGTIGTEMPLSLRPKMKRLVKKVASPLGTFFVGIFVTLFLLPCTIGPYLVFSGKASALTLVQRIPWLLAYNLIFVLPMLAITFIIYLGLTTVKKVSGWRKDNIKYLHLVEAAILIILGIAMFTGLI